VIRLFLLPAGQLAHQLFPSEAYADGDAVMAKTAGPERARLFVLGDAVWRTTGTGGYM
jgi:hypothetical protein